jgi:hypothetical protein
MLLLAALLNVNSPKRLMVNQMKSVTYAAKISDYPRGN